MSILKNILTMSKTIILGNIITMDKKRPFAKAALVKNGVFTYIGSAEEAKKLAGADGPSIADKVRHAVRHTFITKRLVNLMIKNMSAHDENAGK